MGTELVGPNIGTNVFDSVYQAFQQGATFGNAVMSGLTTGFLNLIVTIGAVDFGSTFDFPAPPGLPVAF